MKRRDFLFGSLASVLYVACGSDPDPEHQGTSADGGNEPGPDGAPGSSSGNPADPDAGEPPLPATSTPADSDRVFPQGLASGDPRPDRVVLWSRVDPAGAGQSAGESLTLGFVIARDEALQDVVARGTVQAIVAEDHTVRVIPTGLEPGTVYHYRFHHETVTTRVGRTKTAPSADADVPVRFAQCSCQDYIGRHWHSWQALIDEDPERELDFVLFLGDYIYESVNDPRFQTDSDVRTITLPDGLDTSENQDGSQIAAGTLADYRTLYKIYRSDPLLREVHRLYPFVLTWDDHEFADDCWQDHSTSFNDKDPVTGGPTNEQNTPRRTAANRAFWEFQPADVMYDANASFPNDIRIYRSLRFGQHVELFMTDQRMYRSDHVVAEGPADLSVGKIGRNTSVGSRYFVRKSGFDSLEAEVKPQMLGAVQKTWFVDAVKASTATWKVWGNEVQLWQMALRLSDLPGVPGLFAYTAYVNCDQWDGYRSERREILSEFRSADVKNLLVCTGDIHSFFASEIKVDFDNANEPSMAVEYVTAGISSASLNALVDSFAAPGSTFRPVVDGFIQGAVPGLMATNSHLKYGDVEAYGFALVTVSAAKSEVTFVEMGDPRDPVSAGVVGRTRFETLAGEATIRPVG